MSLNYDVYSLSGILKSKMDQIVTALALKEKKKKKRGSCSSGTYLRIL